MNTHGTKKKWTSIFAFLLTFSLMASCANGPYYYDTWDEDDNAYLDDSEFYSGLDDIGYYDTWNLDGDELLSEEEWNTGVDQYLGDYDPEAIGDFTAWDDNGDDLLSEEEFEAGIFDVTDLDDDDQIGENEFDNWYDEDLI